MTAEQAYFKRMQKRVKGLRNAMIIISSIAGVLIIVFSIMAAVDWWIWICAGLLPTSALWFISTLVLFILWVVNRNKLLIATVPKQIPGEEVIPYPIRVRKPFIVRYDTNVKISFYTFAASIVLGVIVVITFLVDTNFETFARAGSTFLVLMGGAIIVFHIFYTRFGSQIKQIMSYDENTLQFGSRYFTYTTFGIYFLYLGFFVNILFTPRITSVFVISRLFLVVCFVLITYGSYNLFRILKYYQAQELLEKDQPLYSLFPYSSFAITALLVVETIIRKIIHQIYFTRQCPETYTRACERFYRQKAVWLGSLDLVFFTLLLAAFLYSLYVIMRDLKPVITQIASESKIDDLTLFKPYAPPVVPVAPVVEYAPPAKVVEEKAKPTKAKPTKKVVLEDDMMYCESCGEKIRREAKFCEFCGSTVQ